MSQVQLSIVVPVYDEESNLPDLRSRLDDVLPTLGMSYEVILVDDGSSDGSFALGRALAPFLTRSLPSMMANWLISRLTGVPLHDYGCTLKAYRREVIQDASMYG